MGVMVLVILAIIISLLGITLALKGNTMLKQILDQSQIDVSHPAERSSEVEEEGKEN